MKTVEDVLSSYGINFKSVNKNNYVILCPFHNDKHPSLSIRKDSGLYKCWACGAKGNLVSFVKDYEKISYEDAKNKIYGDRELKIVKLRREENEPEQYTKYYKVKWLFRLLFFREDYDVAYLRRLRDNTGANIEYLVDRQLKIKQMNWDKKVQLFKFQNIVQNCFEYAEENIERCYERFIEILKYYEMEEYLADILDILGDVENNDYSQYSLSLGDISVLPKRGIDKTIIKKELIRAI